MSVRVAVSFNKEIGGASALSAIKLMGDLGGDIQAADYRKLVPVDPKLPNQYDCLYKSEAQFVEVFSAAKQKANETLKDADCLVLTGNNAMIDPRFYGRTLANEGMAPNDIDIARSIAELALLHVAMQKGMPVLGICGGHQLINVYLGGSVAWLSAEEIKQQKMIDYTEVNVVAGSELASVIAPTQKEEDATIVHRFFGAHMQVVDALGGVGYTAAGDLLRVVATANDSRDNIEAVESQYGAPIMGMQFHPEVGVHGLQSLGGGFFKADEGEQAVNRRIAEHFYGAAETFHRKKRMLAELVNETLPETNAPKMNVDKKQATHFHFNFIINSLVELKNKIRYKVATDHLIKSRVKMAEEREKKLAMAAQTEELVSHPAEKPVQLFTLFSNIPSSTPLEVDKEVLLKVARDFLQKKKLKSSTKTDAEKWQLIRLRLKGQCDKYLKYLDGEIAKLDPSHITSKRLLCLQEKRRAVEALIKALPRALGSKKITELTNNFYQTFEKYRPVFKKNDDSMASIFVKAILSILAGLTIVGLFAIPEIWKKKDNPYIDAIEEQAQICRLDFRHAVKL